MDLTENRLYRNRQDSNKVVVVKELRNNEVIFLHAPPKRETLSLSDFKRTYRPFK